MEAGKAAAGGGWTGVRARGQRSSLLTEQGWFSSRCHLLTWTHISN